MSTMSTIIMRNAFLFNAEVMKHPWPAPAPDVAYYTRDTPRSPLIAHTWDEVMEARRKRQAEILYRKRGDWMVGRWRPVFLDTRFYDMDFYGGWQCYIYGVGGIAHWVKYECRKLMELIPLRDPAQPLFDLNWYNWKRVFAQTYQRGEFCDRPRGRLTIWARISGESHWAAIRGYALTKP